MKVDERVEPPVREALAAAVGQNDQRFADAITDIATRGDEFFQEALTLALAICSATLMTIHKGQRPSDEQLAFLAREVTKDEEWASLEESKAQTFLTALADRQAVDEKLSVTDITRMSYVVGAWLLSSFVPEDKPWSDLLDEVETWLEVTPD